MRIAFLGAVEFSHSCLQEVLRQGGNVVVVLSLDPAKAARHSDYVDLAPLAQAHGIPVIRVNNINDPETLTALRAVAPDVIFVFGWSQIVGPEFRSIAPCIGTHPALLPRNRGRHPIVWALVNDLRESGLTFFYIDEGVDSGDVLWQRPFAISDEDDAGTLLHRIAALAQEGIREFLPQLMRGEAPRVPQDHAAANYWRKRGPADGEIPWEGPARSCFNLIRALTHPYPGAHTGLEGEKVIVWRSRLTGERSAAEPGTIVEKTTTGSLVATGDELLEILQSEGPPLRTGARFHALLPALTT
jgi:methionyl-tRNA formyltransferase